METQQTAEVQVTDSVTIEPTPSAGAIAVAEQPVDQMQTSALTDDESQRAKNISASINVLDTESVLAYGSQTQEEIAQFADGILDEAKSSDIDAVGVHVTDIVSKAKSLDVSGLNSTGSFLSKLPIIGGIFDKIAKTKQEFESISTHIETVTGELDSARTSLINRVGMLDDLYTKNVDQFRELNLYIAAGEMAIDEMTNVTLPKMEAEVAGDPMKAQEVSDFKQAIQRFEKKIHDLKLTRISTLQTGPQIRVIQSNNQTLAEKIQSTINLTIPLWKKQFLMALSLNEQKKAAALQTAVSDATNDFLRSNADMLKDNSLAIARENERGVIDIETLEHVQGQLISTLEETLAIQQEGKAAREAASAKMVELEKDIQQRLLS